MFTQEVYVGHDPRVPILCNSCGQVNSFEKLVPGDIQEVPNPSRQENCQLVYYHCPNCNSYLIYKRGEDSPLQLLNNGRACLDYSI